MTVRRELTATGSAMSSLHMDPGDFYTMTDTLRAARLPSGRPKVSAGLGVAARPGRMLHRVSGN